jgi:hypothetical protein
MCVNFVCECFCLFVSCCKYNALYLIFNKFIYQLIKKMLPIITTGSGFSTCFPYFLTPKVLISNKKARHFAAPD